MPLDGQFLTSTPDAVLGNAVAVVLVTNASSQIVGQQVVTIGDPTSGTAQAGVSNSGLQVVQATAANFNATVVQGAAGASAWVVNATLQTGAATVGQFYLATGTATIGSVVLATGGAVIGVLGTGSATLGYVVLATSGAVIGIATVQQATAANLNALVAQGSAAAAGAAWPMTITDLTNTAAVKATSVAATATDTALVVAISPNSRSVLLVTGGAVIGVLGTGAATIGAVQLVTGAAVIGALGTAAATIGQVFLATAAATIGQVVIATGANVIGALGTAAATIGQVFLATANATIGQVALVTGGAVVGTVEITGHTGSAVDATGQNAASPTCEIIVGGQFNTTPTTVSSGNVSPLQIDTNGNLLVKQIVTRTPIALYFVSITGVATAALATMQINKGGTITSGTAYTVTTAKTFRIQNVAISGHITAASAIFCRANVLIATAVTAGSQTYVTAETGTEETGTILANSALYPIALQFPDGLEVATGVQVGVLHIGSSTGYVITGTILGYEY